MSIPREPLRRVVVAGGGLARTCAVVQAAAGAPAVLGDDVFGMASNRFRFNLDWVAGRTVVVEACTNLAAPVWLALETNELADGAGIFEDEEETTARGRFYRVVPAP